jgi:hypothetical protein
MLRLRVDSSLIPGVNAPIPVDALLSAIEPVLAQSGRIVTALRINGVEEPAFREPDILARPLLAADDIDLDTTPVAILASGALDDAVRFLPELCDEARGVAAGLRGPEPEQHRRGLAALADNLALLAALVHTADLWARQAGLAANDWLGDDVAAVERVAGSLETAAGAGDWGRAADALDNDLTAALGAWRARLVDGRTAMHALVAVPTA